MHQPLILDPVHVHDFKSPDERKKSLKDKDPSTTLTIARGPREHAWSPYVDNGGTAIGIAGKGYVVVAADTRMSLGFSIVDRESSKVGVVSPNCVIATGGMQADRYAFIKNIGARIQMYEFQNQGKKPSVPSIAQLVSTLLYYRRFFPYYCFTIVAGVEQDTEDGYLYSYDAVGCLEKLSHSVVGTGRDMIEPLLDGVINKQHRAPDDKGVAGSIPLEQAIEYAKRAFRAASERDIYTGDQMELYLITREGMKRDVMQLRKD